MSHHKQHRDRLCFKCMAKLTCTARQFKDHASVCGTLHPVGADEAQASEPMQASVDGSRAHAMPERSGIFEVPMTAPSVACEMSQP